MASHNPLLDVTYTWYHGTRMIEFQKYFWIGETQYITWYNPYYKRVNIKLQNTFLIMNNYFKYLSSLTLLSV